MAFSGSDFVHKGEIKGTRQAWLTFADGANQDVVDALKERLKEIRGETDDAWKEIFHWKMKRAKSIRMRRMPRMTMTTT